MVCILTEIACDMLWIWNSVWILQNKRNKKTTKIEYSQCNHHHIYIHLEYIYIVSIFSHLLGQVCEEMPWCLRARKTPHHMIFVWPVDDKYVIIEIIRSKLILNACSIPTSIYNYHCHSHCCCLSYCFNASMNK